MKKSIVFVLSIVLLISLNLTACNLIGLTGSEDGDESMAQTLVAMAFTQTAIAEAQKTEAPPPEETGEPAETEAMQETLETETEAPPEIEHTVIPNEPGWINKWFYDTDASKTAGSKYVTGGDDFVANLYERPFTESDMVYRPDVDINKTEISEDGTFYYVTLYLNDQHPDGGLQAIYGVEIDTDRNGRGVLLVTVDRPTSSEWDIAGVSAYKDPNHDVGGSSIMRPNTNYTGDGYDQVVFSMDVLDDPDAAWARADLGSPPSVTIAFKKSLIAGYGTFVWGVWAADSLLDPALIDLHDHYTQAEAGSPYQSHSTYPLAALNLVDNTCRETYGFEADVPIPGLCYLPEPTPNPPTATTEPQPGTITGVAFDDYNNNGARDAGEPFTIYSVTITAHQDSCSNPSVRSTSAKFFTFSGLPAGTYCVKITGGSSMTTPSSYTFALPAGGTQYVEFGFYVIQ